MTQSPFFIVVAIITVLFGLALLFIPDVLMSWYGATIEGEVGRLLGRVFGAAMIGLAIIYFMARDLAAGMPLTGLLWAGLVVNALHLILSVMATTGGTLSALGWGQALLHLVLGAGFAYLLFVKPTQS